MTTAAPTFHQIKAQVAAIRKKATDPDARVIGIRSAGRWTAERTRKDGDETYIIEQCDSPLAVRIALREQGGPRTTKVVVTSLDERELGDDILVRLAKRQLFPVDPWQIVKSLFQAHAVDPRLTRHRWIADSLIEVIPDGGYPSAIGGFLDAETVWAILLECVLGLRAERPDLLTILRWSIDAAACERYRTSPTEFREAASAWLAEIAGPAVEPVLRCIERNPRPDAVPVGLAASVVFNPKAAGKLERSTGKMEERFFGGKIPDAFALERWAAAATEVVRTQITDHRHKGNLLQRGDEILKEVGAQSFAHLSVTSPLGFNQRLEAFGKHLTRLIEHQQYDDLDGLVSERAEIGEHEFAARERRRLERMDMSIRLLRWLSSMQGSALPQPRSLGEAADYHLREGGYADWSRLSLRLGDPIRELSEAYSLLFERVTDVRERQARHFAELLRLATEAGSYEDSLVPVEQILDRIVGQLAKVEPVLLIVIDGMSVAVARELLGDIVGQDWIPVAPEHRGSLFRAGLATIPSVTEVSRTSLFCGTLRPGSSADERIGFAAHPALRAASRDSHPPILFHKASLQDEGDAILAAEVREEIASAQRRVVGVVINAVDDQLLKGEQLDTRWTRDAIPVLPALMHEAKIASRLVVLLSDHGHVLDARTKGVLREGGERWRLDDGSLDENELLLRGPRVVITDSKTLIAPWSERIRYGVKKNGYHGGATPQEMVIPIAVLSPSERFPEGWVEFPMDTPVWWEDLPRMAAPPVGERAAVERAVPKRGPEQTNLLFDRADEAAAHAESAPTGIPAAAWVPRLLASPTFVQQQKLAGRSAPPENVVGALLAVLDQRGGKMTSAALARAMNYPPLRLRGLIAVAQRVLNVDGYSVLSRDETSDTVELNRELLKRQFDLE